MRTKARHGAAALRASIAILPPKKDIPGPLRRTDLEQNTPDWYDWRDRHICGSDAPVIMLADAYADPYRSWLEKTGRAPRKVMRDWYEGGELVEHPANRGHRLEDVARQWYCRDRGLFTAPVCVEHRSISWMACSLDGWPEQDVILEVKCPSDIRAHLDAREGHVPEAHYIQMQHNLCVANVGFCDYVSYWTDGSDREPSVCVLRIAYDRDFVERELLPAEEEFRSWVEGDTFPLPEGQVTIADPNDEGWKGAVEAFLIARRLREEAERDEGKALRQLKLRTRGAARTRVGSIECRWYVRRGVVSWSSIPEVQQVASRLGPRLEDYRNPPTLAFRVNRQAP
jgi:putative phage-type endonuclease